MAFPFLGSWFLFTFSSVGLSTSFPVALSFCILSNTNAFEDSSTVNVSTSDCWMSERDTTCCAFDNNSFAAVIVAVVFSVSFTFTNN